MIKSEHEQNRIAKITGDFRKYCAGKLYWKHKNPRWTTWHQGDLARVTDSTGITHNFTRLDEIEAYIIDCLAYPDNAITRDFSNGRAEKRKKPAFKGLIKFHQELDPGLAECPRCLEIDYARHKIEIVQESGREHLEEVWYCLSCGHSDNATLARAYIYVKLIHELPF